MNYIDTHVYSMTGLSELGSVFSYNYSYLSTTFHSTTGRTLNDYYRSRKLEVAPFQSPSKASSARRRRHTSASIASNHNVASLSSPAALTSEHQPAYTESEPPSSAELLS